jgi:hypothetical protein
MTRLRSSFLEAEGPGATVEQDSMMKDDERSFTLRIHGADDSKVPTADPSVITKSCRLFGQDHAQKNSKALSDSA